MSTIRTIRKWAPISVFETLYKSTIEPIITYAIEAWYPSQVILQNSIERVNKFAAKLHYKRLQFAIPNALVKAELEKPISQTTLEKRAIIVHNYVHGSRTLPDNAIVQGNYDIATLLVMN